MSRLNSVVDRALSEHRGSGLYTQKENGLYSMFLPITNTGDIGGAPEQLDKTVVGNEQASSVQGRQSNEQKTSSFFGHRDNIDVLESVKGKTLNFLRLLPDFTAYKYSGTVAYSMTGTDVGGLEQGEITITPTTPDVYVRNAYDIVEDTVVFANEIPEIEHIKVAGTSAITLATVPGDASITVVSDTVGVATAAMGTGETENVLTITGVAKGSAIVTITSSKTGYNSFKRTVLVVVE